MMVILAATGAAITFIWARDLFGPVAGLLALGLYAFSPNLLAHGMLITTDVPVTVFSLLTLYLFWRQHDNPRSSTSIVVGLALGAAMTSKYSGGLLPLLVTALAALRALRQSDRKPAVLAEIRNLAIMAVSSLFVVEASYLFAESPLTYFVNAQTVNTNHSASYQYYLLGQLKQGGWWYYFLVALAFKATLATLILTLLAVARAFSGFINRHAEFVLLAGIGFYLVVMSVGANGLGIRYVLPIFPMLFIWVSRIAPDYWSHRIGRAVLVVLFAWHVWSAVSAFPNYIPFFNELAGGPGGGPDILDDSNIDWGQGLKQAAAYVKENGIQDALLCSFSPFDNPQHYGLPPNLLAAQMMQKVLYRSPAAGTYIISAHYVARMKTLDPAWRSYWPVARIGESLWVYRF
jgi:4-amino-4-deoxy-L-arabinose transferase-like glycosyltransferase